MHRTFSSTTSSLSPNSNIATLSFFFHLALAFSSVSVHFLCAGCVRTESLVAPSFLDYLQRARAVLPPRIAEGFVCPFPLPFFSCYSLYFYFVKSDLEEKKVMRGKTILTMKVARRHSDSLTLCSFHVISWDRQKDAPLCAPPPFPLPISALSAPTEGGLMFLFFHASNRCLLYSPSVLPFSLSPNWPTPTRESCNLFWKFSKTHPTPPRFCRRKNPLPCRKNIFSFLLILSPFTGDSCVKRNRECKFCLIWENVCFLSLYALPFIFVSFTECALSARHCKYAKYANYCWFISLFCAIFWPSCNCDRLLTWRTCNFQSPRNIPMKMPLCHGFYICARLLIVTRFIK